MRFFSASGIALSMGLLCAAGGTAKAASYGAPSTVEGPQVYETSYSSAMASSPYSTTITHHESLGASTESALHGGHDGGCGCNAGGDSCGCGCDDCCGPSWFISAAGLILTRDNPNRFWTTYETNNNPNQLMNTKDADTHWDGGAEIRFGRFGCADCEGRRGWEVVYYGTKLRGFASVRDPGNELSTPINLNTQTGTFDIGPRAAEEYFDNAREHRIWRDDEIHNVEINFLQEEMVSNNMTQVTWLAGFRFFRFDESLVFGSVAGANAVNPGAEFGNNGGEDEAYLDIRCENNLIGFQIGLRGDYFITDNFGLFALPKLGLYANEINSRARLYSGDGVEAFDIRSNENDFTMLASIDLGIEYQISSGWKAYAAYRAVAVSGIALSDDQFPAFIAAADELADIDTNGDLLLHGAVLGLEYRY